MQHIYRLIMILAIVPLALFAIPSAPTDLQLTAQSYSVELAWKDNAFDETGYKIYRDDALIATTAVDVTQYVDTGLLANHAYTYKVVATDDGIAPQVNIEDAEDLDTVGWALSDGPDGSTIENIFDANKSSQVISMQGIADNGLSNGFMFGSMHDDNAALKVQNRKVFTLSMNYAGAFRYYVPVETTAGRKILYYSLGSERGDIGHGYIHLHVDAGFADGKWHIFSRNLEEDLHKYQADVNITSIDGVLFQGYGKVDDITFSQNTPTLAPTIIDDFENGLPTDWSILVRADGDAEMSIVSPSYNGSNGFIHLIATGSANQNNYVRPIYSAGQTILELEAGGIKGELQPHYLIGVVVMTPMGRRNMIWDSYYNHENYGLGEAPKKQTFENSSNVYLVYPSPVELVRGYFGTPTDFLATFRVDLNRYMHILEPDNRVLYVESFVSGGGYLDNIKLLSK